MHIAPDTSKSWRRNGGAAVRSSPGWKTARVVVVASLALFALSRIFFFLDGEHAFSRESVPSRIQQESRAVSNLQLPPVASGRGASLSGGHIGHDEQAEEAVMDIEDKSLVEEMDQPLQGQSEHPRIALMFLVKGEMHNEPIWRQFLEDAARLRLKVATPKSEKVNLRKWLGKELHTPIPGLEEVRYPGYKIQHGLVPPSKYRSTDYPHVRRRNLLEENSAVSIEKEMDLNQAQENKESTEKSLQKELDTQWVRDPWRNQSNLGCESEQEALKKQADLLLNDQRMGSEIYANQDLFTIYVHATPGHKYPLNSLFSGLEIPSPTNVTNGFALHSLIVAELILLEAALQDERNQKFVLLSEACAPIHPPEVIYAQLMHESKSRINACLTKQNYGRLETWRWKTKMETRFLNKSFWRKSQQWFILNRFHAELAVRDQHIKEVFKRYCWSYGKHICVSDEHYLPTLLASYGLDDETDCLGEGTWTNWSSSGWHPKTFAPEEIAPSLLNVMQNKMWPPCDPEAARRTALKLFNLPLPNMKESVQLEDTCLDDRGTLLSEEWHSDQAQASPHDWTVKNGYLPLGYECPLFARKFSADDVAASINATLSCSGAALGPWCMHAMPLKH